jgi:large subunit ribosomal protein L46
VTAASSSPEYTIKTGLVLSRPPLLTRAQTPFEKAFFFYQKRLNERLAIPFTRYFYFKKDTPADHDWKLKAKDRNGTPARELGGYKAYGDMAWNDELMVNESGLTEPKYMIDSLVRDAEVRAVEGKDGMPTEVQAGQGDGQGRVEKPLERWTSADKEKDMKRLDRKLERTLYLCVQRENGGWGFPAGTLVGRENLRQVGGLVFIYLLHLLEFANGAEFKAAERILVQTAGLNMNTWIVGHAPVAHHIIKPRYTADSLEKAGEKTFFMKARIMAGQANLKDNLFGLNDFKWLTKQEVEKHVGAKYFSSIRNMLADR